MRLLLFGKTFLLALLVALLLYGLTPMGLPEFLKTVALGLALSIGVALAYPELRGIRTGDRISAVANSFLPSLIGRTGSALSPAKKNSRIRIRFDNGEEALGVVEGYEGIISPPRVRVLYEEKKVG